MITATVCGGDEACIMNSLDMLGHSDAAARAAAYANGSGGDGSGGGWSDAGGPPTSSGSDSEWGSGESYAGSSGSGWDGPAPGAGGSGDPGGAWEVHRQLLQGRWPAEAGEAQGRSGDDGRDSLPGDLGDGALQLQAAVQELALDLDSWQQIGFPSAVVAAVVACKNGVKRAHLIDESSDGCASLPCVPVGDLCWARSRPTTRNGTPAGTHSFSRCCSRTPNPTTPTHRPLLEMYTRDGTPGRCTYPHPSPPHAPPTVPCCWRCTRGTARLASA